MTREVTNIFFKMFTKTMLVTFPLLFYQENDFNGWTVTLFIHGPTVTGGGCIDPLEENVNNFVKTSYVKNDT